MISKKIVMATIFIFAIPLLLFPYSLTVDYKDKYPVIDMNDTNIDDDLGDFIPNILHEDKLDLKVIECDGFIIFYSERFKTPVLAIYRHIPGRNPDLDYYYYHKDREEGYLIPVEVMDFSQESLEDARSEYNKIPGEIANDSLARFEDGITSLIDKFSIWDLHYRDKNGNIVRREQNDAVIITGLEIKSDGDDIKITNNVWKMVLIEVKTDVENEVDKGFMLGNCVIIRQGADDEIPMRMISNAFEFKVDKGVYFNIIRPSYRTYQILEHKSYIDNYNLRVFIPGYEY